MSKEIEKQDDFREMELRDEQQILAEIKGAYLQEFVYDFTVGSRKVTGLSWAGVKEIAYRMGGVRVDDLDIQDKGEYWIVTAKAVDVTRNASRFGVSTQSKTMKLRSGESVPDDFAVQKAVSKAQRNAIRALIPEVFVKTCLEQFLAEKKGVSPTGKEAEPRKQVDSEAQVQPPEQPAYKPRRFDDKGETPNGNEQDGVSMWQGILKEAGFTEKEVSDNVEFEVLDNYRIAIHQKLSYLAEPLWKRFMQVVNDQRGIWNKAERRWEGPC